MAARTLAFTLGALFTHQLIELPDALYMGLAPLLLPIALRRGPCAIGAAFLIGIAWTALHGQMALDRRLPVVAQGSAVVVDGRIIEVVSTDAARAKFTLRAEQVTAPPASEQRLASWRWQQCNISVSWYRPGQSRRPLAGERWRVALKLRQPRGLRNIGGYDSEHQAMRSKRCASAYVRAGNLPMQLPGTQWSMHRWREDIGHSIGEHLHDSALAGVIVALAVGLRDRISVPQRWVMQRTGTAHLMAISGLHIGLVASLGMLLGRSVARTIPRLLLIVPANHWGAVLAFVFALLYAALAGFSVPTQRALLMLSTFIVALILGRNLARHHGLALALLVILIIDPLAVHDAGTWLSFVAVAGLMWALGPIVAKAPGAALETQSNCSVMSLWCTKALRYIRAMARVQLVATVVVLPLALACFAFQSVLSPLANLVAIPVTGFFVVPLILFGVLVDPLLPQFAGEVLRLAAQLMEFVFVVLRWLATADLIFTAARAPSAIALFGALVGVAVLLSPMTWRLRLLGLAWLAPLLMPPSSAPPADGLDLHVLDVGQGLAVVVRTHSHSLLFDAGPSWSNGNDAGASIVVPMLHRQGIAQIEKVLISHHHLDHAGGLIGVLRAMPAAHVMGDHGYLKFDSEPCKTGQHWRWDEYDLQILHPSDSTGDVGSENSRRTASRGRFTHGANSGNDGSCVLRISGPGGSVLLPADIEVRTEEKLLSRSRDTLRSDVLLVPHHGSRTSSTRPFLLAVQPTLAINSSGHRNRFSLPAADVVARYRALNIPFLDTACNGALHVQLRAGRPPQVSHWRQTQLRFWHTRDRLAHCED